MNEIIANAERYDIGELVKEANEYKVFRAVELSVNAPCFFHRIELPAKTAQSDQQLALVVMRNYARLRTPRVPRVPDAWFADDHMAVVEYKWDAQPLSLTGRNPFTSATARQKSEIFERSLFLLASLHLSNIVHSVTSAEAFGIDAHDKIFLLDTGLDEALVRALHQTSSAFALATNLQSRDLARWAYSFLSLLTGGELLPNVQDDNWDEVDFRQVESRIAPALHNKQLIGYFLDCLSAFRVGDPAFETASAALEHWKAKKIGGLFT